MFCMVGTLPDGTEGTLIWRAGGFVGTGAAVDAVRDLIADRETVGATAEGPYFPAGDGDFETAVATAAAAFDTVRFSITDEPDGWPEYDGGVVQGGPDLVAEPAK